MPASAPCVFIASDIRRKAGMSASSQSLSSMKGVISEVWCISVCSVKITPQPPSALIPRIAAAADGSR